ncbi:2OG-Fe(II) oxygenase [Photobacterium galatheae]|uniref:Fe2OG dioxygenase domain-containing protein n=1 Tax=Photobacterium galatheae TaxID=1654360 RepID=A0A066RUS5_9GAMM|nr:2OG-Fe(II) oxygenase [Photobacterium galatheae]KDM91128.1 hypothetical protein EA58_13335 [Photobacterium galatheae]MCM0150150.1 2OG-Fe(II) oxygenase [Photobacterium galatheae]
MINMMDLVKIERGVLTSQQCDYLIREYENHREKACQESSFNAQTKRIEASSFRAVSLQPQTTAFDLLHTATTSMIEIWIEHLERQGRFNTALLRRCLRFSHDYRILKYQKGERIHPHTDWDFFTLGSCSFMLNDDYTGGEFVYFNREVPIVLKKGDAIIWPADCFWVHEVKAVEEGVRYSSNSFIGYLPEPYKEEISPLIEPTAEQLASSLSYLHKPCASSGGKQ